jgi:ABC-type branched-subunit amino acid transport system ATPase component
VELHDVEDHLGWHEQVDGKYWFPTYTKGEGILHFQGQDGSLPQDTHLRSIVKYTDYKLFHATSRIIYNGEDITSMSSFKRAQAGLVRTFQLASEFKKLTVLENLVSAIPNQSGDSFTGSLRGKRFWGSEDRANIERAAEVLEGFGLSQYADTYAGGLSGGQRRLVEIMRALLAEPKVLLLDEPMAGVHPNLAHKIGDQLTKMCESGMTILMVEHELSIMDAFCDPVIVLAEGMVLATGTMAELRQRPEVVEAYLVG